MNNSKLDSHEAWEPIPGSIYEISSLGRVRNGNTGNILKSQNKHGYRRINLRIDGKDTNCAIHRLVAMAFIDNPDNKPQVNHKDGDKANNHVDNLEWVTGHENLAHAVENHLWEKGCERAKANGGTSGYNRKDKPKAYLRNSERISKDNYEKLISMAEEEGCSIYGLVKKYKEQRDKAELKLRESKTVRHEDYKKAYKAAMHKIQTYESADADRKNRENTKKALIGQRNNYLTVIGYGKDMWGSQLICRCDCGNITLTKRVFWERGKVKSCGCKHDELIMAAHPHDEKKQDLLYRLWTRRHRSPEWCETWQDYHTFYDWAYANGYTPGKYLCKIDISAGWNENNCKWGDKVQTPVRQSEIRHKAQRYECNGEMLTIPEMCDKYHVSEPFIRYRVKRKGMTYSEAVSAPKMGNGRPKNMAS